MSSIQLTRRELDELADAVKIAQETIRRINALEVFNVNLDELWEIRNYSEQTAAILYNIHEGIYRSDAVRP